MVTGASILYGCVTLTACNSILGNSAHELARSDGGDGPAVPSGGAGGGSISDGTGGATVTGIGGTGGTGATGTGGANTTGTGGMTANGTGGANIMCTGTLVGSPGSMQCQQDCGFTMPNPATAGLPNPASYNDNGDGSVTDNVTGLIWEKSPSPTTAQCTGSGPATANFSAVTCTQPQAAAYCTNKGSGWHLPTRLELVSLVDFTVESPGPAINQAAFPGTPSEVFWTSSPLPGDSSYAWSVHFISGYPYYLDVTGNYRVRCVRESAIGAAPKCSSSRYQPQSGGAVYDAATGLTWQQTLDAGSYNWMAGKTYCSNMGGTWRLPSLTELQTIVDDTRSYPSIDPTAFPNTPAIWFWTSSPGAGGFSSYAWSVTFSFGNAHSDAVGLSNGVRCVR